MAALALPLERVVTELCKLPGIGRKTAQRLVYHLLIGAADFDDPFSQLWVCRERLDCGVEQ